MHSPKHSGNCFGSNAERRAWEQMGNEKSARVYRFPSINTSIVANIPFRSWWRRVSCLRHFASKTLDVFVANLLGNPLWLVFDCRESLYLLLNAFALVHQEIEGFGVFKKEAVFEHPMIVTSQCIERISLGYDGEATA